MSIPALYSQLFESRLRGRYITLEHLLPILDAYQNSYEISIEGVSELEKEIPMIRLGTGKKVILAWSQMHGNESTTTKAVFDFVSFLSQKEHFQSEVQQFLSRHSFYILPILNPDGAEAYTRENANGVDLNRDAQQLTQRESQVLATVFKKLQPDLCLNLHDQRTIYGLESGLPATVSFLAPAADAERSITPSREIAMAHIVRIHSMLEHYIPGMVGRYDDSFNVNCVGDTFQMAGVPTILFEGGHYPADYQREKTRAYIFYALLELFGITRTSEAVAPFERYFDIPENKVNYKDVIIRNARLGSEGPLQDIAIQYLEELREGNVVFVAEIDCIGNLSDTFGHTEKDVKGAILLINSQGKAEVGTKISTINRKTDFSVVFFSE